MPVGDPPEASPIARRRERGRYEIRTSGRRGCRLETLAPDGSRDARRGAGRHGGCKGKPGEMSNELQTVANEFAPGTVLQGTYRIAGPLAEGGCGEIYLAAVVTRFQEDVSYIDGRWVLNKCVYTLTLSRADLEAVNAQVATEDAALAKIGLRRCLETKKGSRDAARKIG